MEKFRKQAESVLKAEMTNAGLEPDDFVFFENNVGRHTYLSNWEIKVFTKGMEKLGGYKIHNQIENFKSLHYVK
tara:strand:+ start:3886 stop:4107 length:222 start_codon:yes stop_codon:yes gene_type:complete